MTAPSPLVLTDVADGVATLTLNNPDERNTLTAPMVEEIVAAMDAIEADEAVGALVVTGAPPAFCAGANLGNLGRAPTGRASATSTRGSCASPAARCRRIAAVNGAAVGAGMNLALGCDVRIAARRARFDTRFLQIGLHPGRRPHVDAAPDRRPAGRDGGGRVRRGARRRRGRAGRARLPLRRRRRAARRRPTRWRRGPPSAPRELAIVTKQTIRDMADVADHPAAVAPGARAAAVEHPPAVVRRTACAA